MFARVQETDSQLVVKHYRVFGSGLCILLNWALVWETFNTESGGFLTLMLATLVLILAGALAEIRTTVFDRADRTVDIKRHRALGQDVTHLAFDDLDALLESRHGNDTLAVEEVRLTDKQARDFGIASYLVVQGQGGGLRAHLQDWLEAAGARLSKA